jgi:DNA-binding NarL/FixJ family response regulator
MKSKCNNNTAEKPRRVFLVDQFQIVRLAAAEWLNRTPDLVVCGQADNATVALEAITRSKPDIVVTEILVDEDLDFIRVLHQRHPHLPILVFSCGNERFYAPRVLEAGADGYMLKGVSAEGLADGIRRTLEGRIVLSPNMRYRLLVKCMPRKRRPVPLRKSHHRPPGPRLRPCMAYEKCV